MVYFTELSAVKYQWLLVIEIDFLYLAEVDFVISTFIASIGFALKHGQ